MFDYYDYILGLIPLTMGGTATLLALFGVSMTLAIPAGAFVAIPLIGHAMFVRAPVASESQSASQTTPAPQSTQSQSGHTNTAD
jgi:hypothetical protein